MPNHCYNRVRLYSENEQDIKKLHEIFESGTNPKNDKTVFGKSYPNPTGRLHQTIRASYPYNPNQTVSIPHSFQTEQPTIDGITGEFIIGELSGIATT